MTGHPMNPTRRGPSSVAIRFGTESRQTPMLSDVSLLSVSCLSGVPVAPIAVDTAKLLPSVSAPQRAAESGRGRRGRRPLSALQLYACLYVFASSLIVFVCSRSENPTPQTYRPFIGFAN
eukprot:Selendium_serpulae@DN11305_c0_g1_i1.p2